MSERITDAELGEHVRACVAAEEAPFASDLGEVARRIVAEVRQLRGLIVRVLPPDGAPIHHEPSLLGAAELRGQIVRDLVAEAEAIRAEQQPITVLTQEWSIPLNLPARDRLQHE
jgi:hypothetical protein